jgi:hypothetical protein
MMMFQPVQNDQTEPIVKHHQTIFQLSQDWAMNQSVNLRSIEFLELSFQVFLNWMLFPIVLSWFVLSFLRTFRDISMFCKSELWGKMAAPSSMILKYSTLAWEHEEFGTTSGWIRIFVDWQCADNDPETLGETLRNWRYRRHATNLPQRVI